MRGSTTLRNRRVGFHASGIGLFGDFLRTTLRLHPTNTMSNAEIIIPTSIAATTFSEVEISSSVLSDSSLRFPTISSPYPCFAL